MAISAKLHLIGDELRREMCNTIAFGTYTSWSRACASQKARFALNFAIRSTSFSCSSTLAGSSFSSSIRLLPHSSKLFARFFPSSWNGGIQRINAVNNVVLVSMSIVVAPTTTTLDEWNIFLTQIEWGNHKVNEIALHCWDINFCPVHHR